MFRTRLRTRVAALTVAVAGTLSLAPLAATAAASTPAPAIGTTVATGGQSYVTVDTRLSGATSASAVQVCVSFSGRKGRWCASGTPEINNWWQTTVPVAPAGAGRLFYTVYAQNQGSAWSSKSGWAVLSAILNLI